MLETVITFSIGKGIITIMLVNLVKYQHDYQFCLGLVIWICIKSK